MIICTVSDLGLSFGADEIFRGLTFSVASGDRIGIIGVNGVGKSSLFRCITGEYTPTAGQVYLSGSTTVGMLAQNTDLSYLGEMTLSAYVLSAFPELTAMEAEIAQTEDALTHAAASEAVRLSEALNALHARYEDRGAGLIAPAPTRSLPRWGSPTRSARWGPLRRAIYAPCTRETARA